MTRSLENLRRALVALFVLTAGAISTLGSTPAHSAPAAGTVIGNQATATYNDAGGTPRTATSNLVQTTVSQVKSFQLAANGSRTAAPGQTVYYPHTITNTGNGADTYTLNAPTSTNFAAAGAGHGSMAYYLDANGDGVPDNATPINTSGAIPAAGVFRFVAAGTVPAAAASGNSADLVVSVSDTTPATQTNTDTTTVANSVITVTKALSSNSGPGGVALTVTLSYVNSGSATANNVQMTDTLPAGMTYVNGQSRWSVSGGAVLTEANDGVEQGGFPPGIDFRQAGGVVTAIIPSVAAGVSGNVTFQVTIGNVPPQNITNTAQYTTQTQVTSSNTNAATYQVLQTAGVVANGANANSTNGSGEPVTVANAAAGSTFTFNNFVWNLGNGSDTFDITIQSDNFPAGHSVVLMQQDGATILLNSGGTAAPDTGPIPGRNQPCAAPFVTDGTFCGYRVVVRVTLPSNAVNGVYSITKRATSVFNNAVFDDVTDTLSAVSANTVDVTNDRAAPPAGAAVAADGLGAGAGAIIRTTPVTPATATATTSRFLVWITNTGAVSDTFNLTATFAATSAAGVVPPALPAGWSVAILADGGAVNCSTVGAAVVSTGALAANAARLVCAEVTSPSIASGGAISGNYDFDFRATSAINAAVTDAVRDRITIATVRNVTFVPNNTQQTFPGGAVTYLHTITNAGNAPDTVNFNAGCLTDTRAAQGWTSAAYVDTNGNNALDIPPAGDTVIVCGTTTLNLAVGEARSIFVRAVSPASAVAADPANVTTLTGTYSAAISVTDTTSVTNGLVVQKEQQALGVAGCANNNPPAGAYSAGAIAASANTSAGSCIAYRITATNATASAITSTVLDDVVPANTRMAYACSGNGSATPSVTVGALAGSTPANNASGTVRANVGTLNPAQQVTLYFCVKIDPTPVGTPINNQANASGSIAATPIAGTSNTVTATVGAAVAPPGGFSAVLAADTYRDVQPGATVLIAHTLTNTSAAADTYTIATTDLTQGYAFTSVTLYPDANGDGLPDSAVPLANPIALLPGQVLRFVAQLVVPASAPSRAFDAVRISATSVGGATITPIADNVSILATAPADCGFADKALSQNRGTSPGGPVTVTLGYSTCDKPRSRLTITDVLPAGMRYVPGSGRWSVTGNAALSDAVVGSDREGPGGASQIAYDFNVGTPNAVTASIFNIPAQTVGRITFAVEIEPGFAPGAEIRNTGLYEFYDANGIFGGRRATDPASYFVTGSVDLEFTGQRLATAVPGATTDFVNVLTNRGSATDTFDISVASNTFPAGTTFALFKSDGVTPLADTDGNGLPDTGPLAPGASYNIVLRAGIPATAAPGAYTVTKRARSVNSAMRTATAEDAVDTLATRCLVAFDPDQQSRIGRGQHVTYTHLLVNRGNCTETVQAMLDYLGDSTAGWTSAAYVDSKVAGGASIPGVLDSQDAPIARGWSATLQPGENVRILLDVHSPQAKNLAKAIVDSNVTTLVITNARSGALTVKDTTTVDDLDEPADPQNAIRNFTDGTYAAPTPWAVIGGQLWLRANAQACNSTPGAVDSRTVVITGPNGEREEVIAVETGANTAIFVAPMLAVRAPPVTAGNGVLEGRANDVFTIEMLGCGRRIDTVVTLMEPVSVVFDSATNEPIAGARVTLVQASGGQCVTTAATFSSASANPVVTGADGRFAFPPAASGDYCITVTPPNGYRFASRVAWPLLPQGRNLNVTGLTSGGSYGNAFRVGAGGLVVVDIPLDAAVQAGLFVQKEASRTVAEVADFVDYTVRVRNGTGNVLDRADVRLVDDLPSGFAYVTGTARRDGRRIADPAGGHGPRLTLNVGHMDRGEQVTISYRVRIGPGALQGDGTNRVQVFYTAAGLTSSSNVATARVKVTGGVFSDKGFILGKVFLDCNANGVQDSGEHGVPGVRLMMEDGTFVVTDGGGKFSFYAVSNRTHVVKADRTTLPAGARLAALSARHLGDGGSRIVDLKSGELHRADFAIAGCDAAVVEEVKKRIEADEKRSDELALAGTQLTTEARVITDPKSLPASGVVSATAPAGAPASTLPVSLQAPTRAPAARQPQAADSNAYAMITSGREASAAKSAVELEQLVPDLDDTLGFIGLADGDSLPYAQSAVRVKGAAGTAFELSVNGARVPDNRVGKRSVMQEHRVQAWEYIGVDLAAGENTLLLVQRDAFGNERGRQSLRVVAPGSLARIVLELPAEAVADGRTATKVTVKLSDAQGVPVTGRTPVTLEASRGMWSVKDLDPVEPGVQVMVEGGQATFELTPPGEPGEALIAASSGRQKAQARLHFMPELRSMIASGVIEGVLNLRKIDPRALVPARSADGFEQELRHLSREWNDGKTQAGARAAFYLKGKIKGEYLLTAAYDSDKDTQERLFRDIQPDEFYPIYGDSGTRGFDAQSTSRLYVRIDHRRSYLLWGDFTTNATSDTRKLTNYSRSLTGVKHHFENERVSVNAFASRDSTRQVIEELRANGTSGPFQLSTQGALVNSEKVEIITRDRNQPAIIVVTVPQARFSDYEIESLTGRILFKAPVPSVDQNLNPMFVRITYEVDQGGPQFWVAGVDAQVKLGERVEVGGVYVKDKNPLMPFTLAGANLVVKLGAGTYVIGEVARTEHGIEDIKGDAGRLEIKHESKDLNAQAFVARTERGFENPGAYLSQGRSEAGGKLDYKLSARTTIRAEALRTEDVASGAVRDGVAASVQYRLADKLTLEIGLRHAAEKGTSSAVPALEGQPPPQPMPDEVTTVRARLTGEVPGLSGATIYGEAEVDVRDTNRRVLAAGGEYTLPNKGRIYARHEFISSITGPYGLNQAERQNTTAVGIDTEYMKDGRLFSEYRIRDAISGGDVEAALGLKNLWSIAPGLRLGTSFERVQAIAGSGHNENTALALALEYTGSPLWKGSTRLELRNGATQDSLLFTVGLAARVNRDWTALARNAYTLTRNDNGGAKQVIDRMQAGLAWRDNDTNKWNLLARVENRLENNNLQEGIELKNSTQIVSIHADWQPQRPFLVTGRYAAKWSQDKSNGLATRYRAQVIGGRLTWEFAPRWDIGLVSSALFGESSASRQYGLGLELGYLVATNLWVSAGYNLAGYRDADLAGADYTTKGLYVRLRYKFDESLFEAASPAAEAKRAEAAR